MTDASHPTALPTRYERPSALAFLGYATAIVIVLWSFAGAGFSIDKVISSPPRFADFLDRAFPPNMEPKVLARLGWKMLETLQIAFAGAVIGIILSFEALGSAGIEHPQVVTAGIAQALITTAAGLGIAILSVFPYNYFNSRVEKSALAIEKYATSLEIVYEKLVSHNGNQKGIKNES